MSEFLQAAVAWPLYLPQMLIVASMVPAKNTIYATAAATIAVPLFLFGNPLRLIASGDLVEVGKFYGTAGVIFASGMSMTLPQSRPRVASPQGPTS
jgi:hypothetical protein